MKNANHAWAAQVLGMQVNPCAGPDLIDDARHLGIELKFGLKPDSWTVLEWQMAYANNGRTCYWGLGIHTLNRAVSSIRTTDPARLESYVKHRELYVVDWGWMQQFPPHHTQGQTEISQWDNTLRYPKLALMPPTIRTVQVNKGLIHFTKDVDPKTFGFS
jgi:hypothetical protein